MADDLLRTFKNNILPQYSKKGLHPAYKSVTFVIMRITILTYGSRGDVQPHIALGVGLMGAGNQVRIAAPKRFAEMVMEYGLEFSPLAGEPADLSAAFVNKAGSNPIKTMRVMAEYAIPLAQQVWADMQTACKDCDAIIHSFIMMLSGYVIAEQLDIPQISTNLFPAFFPTTAFHAPSMPLINNRLYNLFSHRFFTTAFWHGTKLANMYARRFGGADLPPVKIWPLGKSVQPPTPVLYGISPSVLPKPGDWPAQAHMTGYWFLKEKNDWQPEQDLQHFLQTGPPPVYIGFGSMVTQKRAELLETVVDAVRLSGQRAVLLSGWTGLDTSHLPEQLFVTDEVPHSWLFPYMVALVHHGGAGTTASAFWSGRPQVVVPFAADQPFWAERVHRLGAGTQPLPYRKLTAGKLASAIQQAVNDPDMGERAKEIGEAVQREDGVASAVEIIQKHLKLKGK